MHRCLALTLATALTLQPALSLACTEAKPPRFEGGVGGFEGGVSVSVGRLADQVWVPVHIDGQPVPEGAGLSLSVSFEGQVEGETGCNRFSGKADMDAGELVFGPLAVTEMACPDPVAMEREAAWLKALGEVRGFVVSPEGLWLRREDGSVAVCLW
jgi:heat shock protein HslJ